MPHGMHPTAKPQLYTPAATCAVLVDHLLQSRHLSVGQRRLFVEASDSAPKQLPLHHAERVLRRHVAAGAMQRRRLQHRQQVGKGVPLALRRGAHRRQGQRPQVTPLTLLCLLQAAAVGLQGRQRRHHAALQAVRPRAALQGGQRGSVGRLGRAFAARGLQLPPSPLAGRLKVCHIVALERQLCSVARHRLQHQHGCIEERGRGAGGRRQRRLPLQQPQVQVRLGQFEQLGGGLVHAAGLHVRQCSLRREEG